LSEQRKETDMETDFKPPPATSASGGTVEPANRATVAKEIFQTPRSEPAERYELRDPFADVTYRSEKMAEITAKAAQLGSTRFTAIAVDGSRTVVQKVGDGWQRGKTFAPSPQRPLDLERDDIGDVDVGKRPGAANTTFAKEQQLTTVVATVDATAERAALVERLEAALKERYLIKRAPVAVGNLALGQTEYRFRGDSTRVAFTESTFRLATDTNSPSVARSMVDVAQARNWNGLRVSGSEEFRRMVWLEASIRGVRAVGYEPNPGDLEVLRKERKARMTNRVEPTREAAGGTNSKGSDKPSGQGGGRKAVVAAIEAVLVAKRVPEAQRKEILAAATVKLAQRTREGAEPKVKVYDSSAPSQRKVATPTPEVSRSRDRAAPAQVR
jgi:hypothetical protein